VFILGNLSEKINKMISTVLESAEWTSANPTHINTLIQINAIDNPDLEEEFGETIKDSEMGQKIESIDKGNLGDIKSMSTEQFGNIRNLATNPFGFLTRTILKKLKTGAGILFIVAIAVEVAKFLLLELFKPGRIFDIRFREEISKQIIQFLERKEQQELKQGFKSIITTTIGGLRGDSLRNQIGGNFFTPDRIPARFIDPSRISPRNANAIDVRKKSFQDSGQALARSRR